MEFFVPPFIMANIHDWNFKWWIQFRILKKSTHTEKEREWENFTTWRDAENEKRQHENCPEIRLQLPRESDIYKSESMK